MQAEFTGAPYADESTRNMLQIDGKVFAAQMQIGVMRAVAEAVGRRAGERRPLFIVDQRRWPGVPEDIDLRAEGAGEAGGDFADSRLNPLLHLATVGAQRSLELYAFRQDVQVFPPGSASR